MHTEYDSRGTTRALDVLRALNERNGSKVSELSRRTKISRAALYRILAALERAGYIRRRVEDGAIFVTGLVQSLSSGYSEESWITEIAGPVLEELQRQVVWPTDLGILRNFRMRLAATTRSNSPLVIDRSFAGVEMPIFATSLGQAYVAYCSPSELSAIVDHVASDPSSEDAKIARNMTNANHLIREVRSRGYGYRCRRTYEEKRHGLTIDDTASIAIPIRRDRYAVASLGLTFIASALPEQEAVRKHLPHMQDAAAKIERALARQGGKAAVP